MPNSLKGEGEISNHDPEVCSGTESLRSIVVTSLGTAIRRLTATFNWLE